MLVYSTGDKMTKSGSHALRQWWAKLF